MDASPTRPRTAAPRLLRLDPVLALVALVLAAVATWSLLPLADGASASRDTRIQVAVDNSITIVPPTSVPVPGSTNGASVRLPELYIGGQEADVTSAGWTMGSNWDAGYEVFIKSTSSPALRGEHAVDGHGVADSFRDFTAGACPCPWTTDGFAKGVFGYSAVVGATAGSPLDTAKWGTSTSRKFRGLTTQDYRLFDSGGRGTFSLGLLFRSEIPHGKTQSAGSYRANVTMSISAKT